MNLTDIFFLSAATTLGWLIIVAAIPAYSTASNEAYRFLIWCGAEAGNLTYWQGLFVFCLGPAIMMGIATFLAGLLILACDSCTRRAQAQRALAKAWQKIEGVK